LKEARESVRVLHARADLSGKQVFYCKSDFTISLYCMYLDGIRSRWIIEDCITLETGDSGIGSSLVSLLWDCTFLLIFTFYFILLNMLIINLGNDNFVS